MKKNIKKVIAPYAEFADCVIDIQRQNNQRPLINAKNKLWNFIETSYPWLLQDGGDIVIMKRLAQGICVGQKNKKSENTIGKFSFNKFHKIYCLV